MLLHVFATYSFMLRFALITSVVKRSSGVIQKFFVLFVYYDKLDSRFNFEYDSSEGMEVLSHKESQLYG